MDHATTNFNKIKFAPLRTFNRCVMMFNILEDRGEDAAKQYMKQFSEQDKVEMIDMCETVKIYGADTVRKDIMKNMELQDDDEDHQPAVAPMQRIQINIPKSGNFKHD